MVAVLEASFAEPRFEDEERWARLLEGPTGAHSIVGELAWRLLGLLGFLALAPLGFWEVRTFCGRRLGLPCSPTWPEPAVPAAEYPEIKTQSLIKALERVTLMCNPEAPNPKRIQTLNFVRSMVRDFVVLKLVEIIEILLRQIRLSCFASPLRMYLCIDVSMYIYIYIFIYLFIYTHTGIQRHARTHLSVCDC